MRACVTLADIEGTAFKVALDQVVGFLDVGPGPDGVPRVGLVVMVGPLPGTVQDHMQIFGKRLEDQARPRVIIPPPGAVVDAKG